MATGWLWEERYAWHDAGIWNDPAATPRQRLGAARAGLRDPETKRRFRNLLDVTGVLEQLVQLRARPATDEEILRVHTPEHLAHVRALGGDRRRRRRRLTMGTLRRRDRRCSRPVARSSRPTRSSTAPSKNAYALVRPPGHHAEPEPRDGLLHLLEHRHRRPARPAGARRRSRRSRRLGRPPRQRHRDGLPRRPSVLAISLHQDEHYPPGPRPGRRGGRGRGSRDELNIPLPPGGGIAAYAYAFERVVVPALRAFRPELIIVASGFDASAYDPLGRMDLERRGLPRADRDARWRSPPRSAAGAC